MCKVYWQALCQQYVNWFNNSLVASGIFNILIPFDMISNYFGCPVTFSLATLSHQICPWPDILENGLLTSIKSSVDNNCFTTKEPDKKVWSICFIGTEWWCSFVICGNGKYRHNLITPKVLVTPWPFLLHHYEAIHQCFLVPWFRNHGTRNHGTVDHLYYLYLIETYSKWVQVIGIVQDSLLLFSLQKLYSPVDESFPLWIL